MRQGLAPLLRYINASLMVMGLLASCAGWSQENSLPPLLFVGPDGAQPYIYSQGSEPSGILSNIATELSTLIGRPIQIQLLDFREARRMVRDGEADAVMPLTATPERRHDFDFTKPLFNIVFTVFARENEHHPSGWPNIEGVRIGVFGKGMSKKLAQKRYPKATTVTVHGTAGAMRLVEQSEIDAMITTRRTGKYTIYQEQISNVVALPITLASTPAAIALQKDNSNLTARLNTAIDNLHASGRIKHILSRWEGTRVVMFSKRDIWLASGLTAVGVSVMFSLLGFFFLRFKRISTTRLQESEQSLRITLDSIGDAVIATDISGNITRMNRVAEKLTGWNSSEAITHPLTGVLKIINNKTREPVANPVNGVLKNGKILALANDTTLIARDGTEYQIADSAAPIVDDHDNMAGVVLVFRDITDEYLAHAALTASEVRFRSLFENAGVALWNEDMSAICAALQRLRQDGVTDLRQYLAEHPQIPMEIATHIKVLKANQAALKLFGAGSENELICQINKTFGADSVDGFIEELCAIWEGRTSYSGEANFKALTGRSIKASISFRIPGIGEDLENVPISIIDLTEIRRAEAALNSFFEQPMNIHLIAKLNGTIQRVNQGWREHLGYTAKELLGSSFLDLVHPDDKARTLAELTRINQGITTFQFENRFRHKQGGYNLLAWSAIASKEDQLIYAASRDITARKAAEAEQERLQRELHQAQKMEALGQLTGGIAHDFNNILGVILGYTELAMERSMDAKRTELLKYLEHVAAAGERAKGVVAQMLGYARTEHRVMAPLHLQPLIKENLKMLQAALPSSIEINLEIEEHLPAVLIEPVQINQLLLNLCINARDAIVGHGIITIQLGWAREVNEECSICHQPVRGNWVELSIADTGSGIPAATLGRMFDPFFTSKEVGKGTGLGLSVVNSIVNRQSGHIVVETEQGKGATFRLLFPPSTEEVAKMQTVQRPSGKTPKGSGEHILIVDDEPDLSDVIGELLKSHGYRATVLQSSKMALSIVEQKPDAFSLVISDQTMPEMTGVELVNAIRQIRPAMPVILTTGFSGDIDEKVAARMGVSFLPKPAPAESLLQMVGKLLELSVQRT